MCKGNIHKEMELTRTAGTHFFSGYNYKERIQFCVYSCSY